MPYRFSWPCLFAKESRRSGSHRGWHPNLYAKAWRERQEGYGGAENTLSTLINFVARHLACCFDGKIGPIKVFLDSLLDLLFQGCLPVISSQAAKKRVLQTLNFLFLQLQLGLHVGEGGFYLLKDLCSFGVGDIEVFVLPLFLSVKVSRPQDQNGQHTFERRPYAETPSNSLSIVSAFASLPTSLRNFGLLTSKLGGA